MDGPSFRGIPFVHKLPFPLCLGLASALAAAPSPSPGDSALLAVAQAALPGFLEKIPDGLEARYGFGDPSEFLRTRLGTPIPVYHVAEMPVDTSTGFPDSSWSRPVSGKAWRIPVLVGPQARVLITVEDRQGQLVSVDFGGARLASEMDEMPVRHPGIRKALLRVDALRCDFLVLHDSGRAIEEGEYRPLSSARQVFPEGSDSSRTRRELFGELRRRMDHSRKGAPRP